MGNPNVLFLDEPTNDLDINTLHALENYLEDFHGVLLIVSHDRAFLDKMVDYIYAFDGKGNIKEYPGNYSNYLEKKEIEERNKHSDRIIKEDSRKEHKENQPKKKLSYKEQREINRLEEEIPLLENQKKELQEYINSGNVSDYKLLEEKSSELVRLEEKIDELTLKWLEIGESLE